MPRNGATVVCADELGPVVPRTFAPAPGWSTDSHRVRSVLDYDRVPEKTWVYGSLRVKDGQGVTMAASSRSSAFYQQFPAQVEDASPGDGGIYVITDNLSSQNSDPTRERLEHHPRIAYAFISVGACRISLREAWWRIFRHHDVAGQSFAGPDEIDYATRTATMQLNMQAKPWIWRRPPPSPRKLRRRSSYLI